MANQVIDTLSEGVGNAREYVEVTENLTMPISDSTDQRIKMEAKFLRNARKPLLVLLFCFLSFSAIVDAEELLFQPVSLAQHREAANPRLEQDSFHRFQFAMPLEQQIPISLQSSSLLVGQGRLQSLPVAVEALIAQAQDMELIDDDGCQWKHGKDCGPVGIPHVHGYHLDLLGLVKPAQPQHDSVLVSIIEEVQNGILADVGQNAPSSPQGEYLIDTQDFRGNDLVQALECLHMGREHVPDRLTINAQLAGDVAMGASGRLLLDVIHGPLRKAMVVVQEGSGLHKRLFAFLTAVTLASDPENHPLAHSGQIDVGGCSYAELHQKEGSASLAASSGCLVLNYHPDGVVNFFFRNNVPIERIEQFQAERLA